MSKPGGPEDDVTSLRPIGRRGARKSPETQLVIWAGWASEPCQARRATRGTAVSAMGGGGQSGVNRGA
eukprot:5020545-Pyramimonas_sp.AAC.1